MKPRTPSSNELAAEVELLEQRLALLRQAMTQQKQAAENQPRTRFGTVC